MALEYAAASWLVRTLAAVSLLALWRRWTCAKDAAEPPAIPYWIPFLGHGWEFLRDINDFAARIAGSELHPGQITTAHLAGRRLYVCLDPAAASELYRRSRAFTFDPFSLQVARALGATEADMRICEVGTWGKQSGQGGKGLFREMHQMLPEELTGEALEQITAKYMQCLRGQIRRQLEESGGEEVKLDLVEFVKRALTVASSEAMFGSKFVEAWETLYEDYWAFDPKIQSLMFGLPRWINRRAYQARDRCLDKIKAWERRADEAAREGKAPRSDDTETVWDEYWGMKLVRRRLRKLKDSGISESGRAMTMIGLLFALNSNAVPTTIWACIHAFTDRDLLALVRAEMEDSRSGISAKHVSITAVAKQPHCRSLLLETLRFATNSPGLRLVTQSTQLGGYSLRSQSLVYVHSRTLQMDASTWTEPGKSSPEAFWAGRFLEDADDGEANRVDEVREAEAGLDGREEPVAKHAPSTKSVKDKTLSLRPFGGGQTICPGRHFALNEMLGGLVTLMEELQVNVDREALAITGMPQVNLDKQGGLFPDRELRVAVCLRKG